MYKKRNFWAVTLFTGFFSGLLAFVLLTLLMHLSAESFSPIYVLIYLLPVITMFWACIRLRERYNYGMLTFSQGFRVSFTTGLFSALFLSLAVYFVFSHLFMPSLFQRVNMLEADFVLNNPGLPLAEIKDKKELIQQMLTPLSLAVYFFIINAILLPFVAFIIAIFARRRSRFIEDTDY